jgi:hypothetical protein
MAQSQEEGLARVRANVAWHDVLSRKVIAPPADATPLLAMLAHVRF